LTGSSRWSISSRFRKKAQSEVKPTPQQELVTASPETVQEEEKSEVVLIDSYSVYEPYVRIGISLEPDGSKRYIVIEPTLTTSEKKQLKEVKLALKNGLEVDASQFKAEGAKSYLAKKTRELMTKFGIKLPKYTFDKIYYFIERDFLRYSKIDPLMRDPNIEDISCNGPGSPIYVFHRTHESIPTNVIFKTQEDLERFILRMAYMSGRHVSVAEPVVDASLPDGSRIQMTFGSEITKKGSTFTIRKFKEDPYSIIDLVKFGTVSPDIAATLWYVLENKGSVLLAGGTASGKSVLGSESVAIYQDGALRLGKISDLFDRVAESQTIRKEGEYETLECDGIETAAFDHEFKVKPFKVKEVIRHSAPKRIFRIRTRTGREVSVTGDHSVFSLVDGEVVPYPASELHPGIFLAVPRILPQSARGTREVDLTEIFGDEGRDLYVENVMEYVKRAVSILGEKEIGEILGLRKGSLREALRKKSMAIRISKMKALARRAGLTLEPSRLCVRAKNYRRGSIPAIIHVSRSLMRLLGYWVSEGMYGKGLKFFNLDGDVRADIHRLVRESFGLETRLHRQDRTRLDVNSKALELAFRHALHLQDDAGNKSIPAIALEQSDELLAEFLRAYFTGNGCMNKFVEVSTKSKELANQLLYALSRFGIIAHLGQRVIRGSTYHRVMIYGRKDLGRFLETIGFLNRENQRRLVEYVSRTAAVHTSVDTIPGIASLLKQCLQFKVGDERRQLWSDWHSYWSSSKRMGNQTLVSFIERTGADGAIRNRLLTLAYSDLFWDEVVEAEEVDCKESYVYDLEVPGAQNFVGGAGGLFLHNTTTINCLALFIRPEAKIVTIEDTPEINLAHINWIQSVSRQGISGMGEVSLYDLLRAALRQRPDFIIVGEVRGEEAHTMFQALSTGHAGMSSIHADSIPAVFHRLTNPPMNIPRTLIPAVNFVLLQSRITVSGKPARKILSATEIIGVDTRTNELITNEVFKYNVDNDSFVFSGRSYALEKLAKARGITVDEVRQEIATRVQIIQWMTQRDLRRYRDVARVVQRYYTDRSGLIAEIGAAAV
jgi:type IV secretory pathway ATPase VirB11/archaellum biosynthesis ATPase/intein/homing endonuclease